MVIHVAAKSDIGCQRDKNEDSFFIDSENGLFIICDGLGGHLSGEIASRKAIEFTVEFLTKARDQRILPNRSDQDFIEVWDRLIVESIENCCDKLIALSKTNPSLDGMATTITLVQFVEGVVFVGHLGDSRLYLKNGPIAKQLTSDHTLFAEFARSNPNWIVANNDPDACKRFKNILTRCAGRTRDFSVEFFNFPLNTDDVLLMCTDGLSNYFEDEETIVQFLEDEDTDSVVDRLVDFANANGGSDNITAIVIRASSLDESELQAQVINP